MLERPAESVAVQTTSVPEGPRGKVEPEVRPVADSHTAVIVPSTASSAVTSAQLYTAPAGDVASRAAGGVGRPANAPGAVVSTTLTVRVTGVAGLPAESDTWYSTQ